MDNHIIIERFYDNGQYSHWELVNSDEQVVYSQKDKLYNKKELIDILNDYDNHINNHYLQENNKKYITH